MLRLLVALCAVLLVCAAMDGTDWQEVWREDFNGPAHSSPSSSNWLFDVGTGIFGTGEIETMTNSTSNVALDGNGHLVITGLRDQSGNWTSGRIGVVKMQSLFFFSHFRRNRA